MESFGKGHGSINIVNIFGNVSDTKKTAKCGKL